MRSQVARRRLILALCLLVLQGQSFAASALGCLHAGGRGDGAPSVCPFHAQPADAGAAGPAPSDRPPGDGGLLDCPKCVLSLGLGHLVQPVLPVLPAPLPAGEGAPLPARHFYSFTPELFPRPPIAAAL